MALPWGARYGHLAWQEGVRIGNLNTECVGLSRNFKQQGTKTIRSSFRTFSESPLLSSLFDTVPSSVIFSSSIIGRPFLYHTMPPSRQTLASSQSQRGNPTLSGNGEPP